MSSSKGFEEIGSAELHGFDGERNIAVYRDDDHRQEHLELRSRSTPLISGILTSVMTTQTAVRSALSAG
jgi:hypothetical protein